MTSYGVRQFQEQARAQLGELGQARTRLGNLKQENEASRAELARRLDAVREELVTALLPYFTPEHLAWVAQVTGFTGLLQKGYPQQAEAEKQQRLERIATIEADEKFRERRLLRDPLVGKLTRAVAELEEFRAPFAEVAGKCAHPRLSRLVESGYGTPRYAVPFWRMSYYADWKAGDEILERFPEKKAFGEVLEGYTEAARMLETYDPRLAELRAEVQAGEALEKDHAAQHEALSTLEARYLGLARVDLGQHLADLPDEAHADLLAALPQVAVTVQKWSGLSHQVKYLEAMEQQQIDPALARVEGDIGKLQKDVLKYSRPKNSGVRFAPADFQRRFDRSRIEKLEHRVGRMEWGHNRVVVFDRYDRGSLASDFLWWDLMTDGKLDGDFIPEVRHFHDVRESQGFSRTVRYQDDDDLAAASAAVSGSRAGHDGDVS